jgi:hypothetical protein
MCNPTLVYYWCDIIQPAFIGEAGGGGHSLCQKGKFADFYIHALASSIRDVRIYVYKKNIQRQGPNSAPND